MRKENVLRLSNRKNKKQEIFAKTAIEIIIT